MLKRPILTGGTNFSVQAARKEVLAAQGRECVRTWLNYYLQEPAFDKDYVPRMPTLGVSESEALLIADYLIGQEAPKLSGVKWLARIVLPRNSFSRRYRIAYFACGFLGRVLSILLFRASPRVLDGRAARAPSGSQAPVVSLRG